MSQDSFSIFLNNIVNIEKLIIERMISFIIIFSIGISGAMLNHQLNIVSPKINSIVIIIAKDTRKRETGSLLGSLFLVLANVNNSIMPQIPVPITHKLEYCSSVIIAFLFNRVKTKIFKITVNPTGSAFLRTFFKKSPRILSLFGSSANKNDGKPIVTVPIKLICIGTNG